MNKGPEPEIQVVKYRVGAGTYEDVSSYDQRRYVGSANEYKQAVMGATYRRMLGPVENKHVLDLGCGTGRGISEFAQTARYAVGCDASLDMLSVARRKTNRPNARFINCYGQRLPLPDSYFDAAITLNFLHLFDLENQRQMVAELKRVVRPGGVLLLEFDNALQGGILGLLNRWFRDVRGSMPWEIQYVIGDGVQIKQVCGAVFPVVWRLFHRYPTFFSLIERLAWFPPFNRLAYRIYYRLEKL